MVPSDKRQPAEKRLIREVQINTLAPPEEPVESSTFGTFAAAHPARWLAALSFADPLECLRVLADTSNAFTGVTPAEISKAIVVAFDLVARDEHCDNRRKYAQAIGQRFCELLTRDAALEMLGALTAPRGDAEEALCERIVQRFPTDASVLRFAIARAQAQGNVSETDALLTQLGLVDRTPATLAFVRRQRPVVDNPAALIRAAILSSYTIDHLVPYVDLACRALNLRPDLYVAPFNSWTREVLDSESGLRHFDPDIVFLAVAIDDLIPQLSRNISFEDLESLGEIALQRVTDVARAFTNWAAGKPLVVHSFHSAFSSSLGIADGRETQSRIEWIALLNSKLAATLRTLPSCYLLDIADAARTGGGSSNDNPKLRHLAAMRLAPAALSGVADAYVRFIAPLKGLSKKCVVLDLDNTLWGGVAGEDGKDGIRLGDRSPGSEFVEFQEFLRSLSERGVLLAICSKNNPEDALDVIRSHTAMVLRESDFSAIRLNWESKADNLRSIAAELNIGIDSLVFVDDNPNEREQMRQLLPEVLTVDLPRDTALYRLTLEQLPQLQTLSVTREDRGRIEQYKQIQMRDREKATAADLSSYLKSLEITVGIARSTEATRARVVQLFAKTNQFNLTSRRYDAAAVERFTADPSYRLWVLSSRDRFGDHGQVAQVLVKIAPTTWTIDSFLMSCRVIGYGIETALLAFVANAGRAAGARELRAEFVPTPKNEPARAFLHNHGFTHTTGEQTNFATLSLDRILESPNWIHLEQHDS